MVLFIKFRATTADVNPAASFATQDRSCFVSGFDAREGRARFISDKMKRVADSGNNDAVASLLGLEQGFWTFSNRCIEDCAYCGEDEDGEGGGGGEAEFKRRILEYKRRRIMPASSSSAEAPSTAGSGGTAAITDFFNKIDAISSNAVPSSQMQLRKVLLRSESIVINVLTLPPWAGEGIVQCPILEYSRGRDRIIFAKWEKDGDGEVLGVGRGVVGSAEEIKGRTSFGKQKEGFLCKFFKGNSDPGGGGGGSGPVGFVQGNDRGGACKMCIVKCVAKDGDPSKGGGVLGELMRKVIDRTAAAGEESRGLTEDEMACLGEAIGGEWSMKSVKSKRVQKIN